MISEAAIDEEARRLGLDVSDDALRAMITSNPDFQNKSGAFDAQKFAELLRDNDLNERFYVSELKKNALRQFIIAALTSGIAAPKAMTNAEAAYEGQTRSADIFVLPASAAGDIPPPSDETLKAYFNERKSSYRAPEYRVLRRRRAPARRRSPIPPRSATRTPRRPTPGSSARTRSSARRRSATSSRSCSRTRPRQRRRRPRSRPARASTTSSRRAISSPRTSLSATPPRTRSSTRPRRTRCSPCPQAASAASFRASSARSSSG